MATGDVRFDVPDIYLYVQNVIGVTEDDFNVDYSDYFSGSEKVD